MQIESAPADQIAVFVEELELVRGAHLHLLTESEMVAPVRRWVGQATRVCRLRAEATRRSAGASQERPTTHESCDAGPRSNPWLVLGNVVFGSRFAPILQWESRHTWSLQQIQPASISTSLPIQCSDFDCGFQGTAAVAFLQREPKGHEIHSVRSIVQSRENT